MSDTELGEKALEKENEKRGINELSDPQLLRIVRILGNTNTVDSLTCEIRSYEPLPSKVTVRGATPLVESGPVSAIGN